MDDPDWMNDFKSPMETVLLLSSSPSSSPSREVIRKKDDFYATGEEVSQSNGKEERDHEDSALISVLRESRAAKKGRKGGVSGDGSSTHKKPPIKLAAKIVTKGAVGAQEEDDDDEHGLPKISYLRRPLGKKKRPLESEEESDDEEYQIPSKVRKTASSPQVKKDGTARAAPKSGRKSKRVSFSEEEGTPQPKRARTVHLEGPVAIEEDVEEDLPISSLIKKKDEKPSIAATTAVYTTVVVDNSKLDLVSKASKGASALASVRDPEGTAADGEDALSTKEEIKNEEETGEVSERKGKPRASSSLPVIFAEKVHRTKVLLECEGDALDLSGDMGAVGRFSVNSVEDNGEDELLLDLKGIIYKATIVPSNTFFVVNVGHAEAKVEAIMNDFMQLRADVHQVQDETLVEGTLDGFGFDHYDEGEPLSTPVTASGPVDSGSAEDPKQKKKVQKPKKVASKGGKGSRAKGAGKQRSKGRNRSSRRTGREAKRKRKGATSKKPRAKAKAITKKSPKAKSAAKSKKSKTS